MSNSHHQRTPAAGSRKSARRSSSHGQRRSRCGRPGLLLWLGDAPLLAGQLPRGLRSYETPLRAEPRSQNAPLARCHNLAYALYKQKDYRNAAKQFRQSPLRTSGACRRTLAADATTHAAPTASTTSALTPPKRSRHTPTPSPATGPTPTTPHTVAPCFYGLSGDHRRKIEELSLPRETVAEFPLAPPKAMLEKALAYRRNRQSRTEAGAESYRRRLEASQQVSTDELIPRMAETMHKAGRWRDLLDVTSRIRAAGGSTPMNWPTSTCSRPMLPPPSGTGSTPKNCSLADRTQFSHRSQAPRPLSRSEKDI